MTTPIAYKGIELMPTRVVAMVDVLAAVGIVLPTFGDDDAEAWDGA